MRALSRLAVVLLVTFGAAGCRRDRCVPICERRAQELHCRQPDRCQAECKDLREHTTCRAELRSFEACFLQLPSDRWYCDDDGKPTPNERTCVPERAAVEDCLRNGLGSPKPPTKP